MSKTSLCMNEYDDIRPYHDDEVELVLNALLTNPDAIRVVAALGAPRPLRLLPPLARWLVRHSLQRIVRNVHNIHDFQQIVGHYFQRMVTSTTDGFSYAGLEHLEPGRTYIFISNHRDIALDSGFLDFAFYLSGRPTVRIAIGDNLIKEPYATDLMRLNKSFIVKRSAKGTKAAYAALAKTSAYIRHSLQQEQESVWIAQREGRAKDGYDRTDPAVIKMLALAYRKEFEHFAELVPALSLVPMSISYEQDPCDTIKARELATLARDGRYEKAADEDLRSIANGITGYKGRVHMVIGKPIAGDYADAEAVAVELDRQIVGNLQNYPVNDYAAACRAADNQVLPLPAGAGKALQVFAQKLACCPAQERAYLLLQYANPQQNRRDLALV